MRGLLTAADDDDEASLEVLLLVVVCCSKKKKSFLELVLWPSVSLRLSLVSTQPRMKHDFFLEGIIKYSQKHQKQTS